MTSRTFRVSAIGCFYCRGLRGAFPRSELAALNAENLQFKEEGLMVLIVRSKTDQEGEGQTIAIPRAGESPYCPIQAVKDWLAAARID